MEVEKAKVETRLEKIVAKKGAYGGYVVSVRKLLNRELKNEEVEKIRSISINKKFKGRICVFVYSIRQVHEDELEKINKEEYSKLRQSINHGEVGYMYYNAVFRIKKVTNNYIVFDVIKVDNKLHLVKYRCLRSKYLKKFTYDEFIDEVIKEFKVTREEAMRRTIVDCIKYGTAYFLDREPDHVMKSFRESLEIAEIEFNISEFLTNEEEDNEIKEIMNEISKLVEKYSEEKVKKAFKILFNL